MRQTGIEAETETETEKETQTHMERERYTQVGKVAQGNVGGSDPTFGGSRWWLRPHIQI